MRKEHIKYVVCPECGGNLKLNEGYNEQAGLIQDGVLQCNSCKAKFDIARCVPRFVPMKNYAAGFGFEWNKHARTQYDSYTGTNVSEKRFFEETKWERDLHGQVILEVGCGSGRFTEQAASTGAMVISIDYSDAVDAAYNSNGTKENVLISQADAYSLPFKTNFFDKIFCIGVIQHTPDPERTFFSLLKHLKPGGGLVIDTYRYEWWKYILSIKYWVRPITKRLSHETLYRWCENYINLMWAIAHWIHKLPKGKSLNWFLLIPDYKDRYPLSEELLKEWAILDLFDMLSPAYDKPQTVGKVKEWLTKAKLESIEVHPGFNGVVGRGIKADTSQT